MRLPDYARALYVLHYVIAVTGRLDTEACLFAADRAHALLRQPDLGTAWRQLQSHEVSIGWSARLKARFLLVKLGDPTGESVIRNLSERMEDGLATSGGRVRPR